MEEVLIVNMSFSIPDKEGKVGYIPLGPLYIVSALKNAGYKVDFIDYLVDLLNNGSQKDRNKILSFFHADMNTAKMEVDYIFIDAQNIQRIIDHPAKYVGIGCTSGTLPQVILAIEEIKTKAPDKTIILGGIGPTGVANDLMDHFPFIDIIVLGEGEETIVEVMDNINADLSGVNGIIYRQNDQVVKTKPRARIQNLDKINYPAFELIDFNNYTVTSITASRGCTFKCSFCDTTQYWGRKNYYRSVENVINELKILVNDYGLTEFEFVDDTFVINRKWVERFCKELKKANLNIKWNCNVRVGLMDEPLMKLMADSGCYLVFYGIESGSNRILKRINKGFTREEAIEAIKTSSKYFHVMPSFIWGFPFETMDDLKETLSFHDFCVEIGCTIWLLTLTPLPLSELFKEFKHTLEYNDLMISKMGKTKRAEEIVNFVRKYPSAFPGFHHYKHDNFKEKYDYIVNKNYMNPDAPSAYLNGVVVNIHS
jgi:anaerobic magnesium-protoporphyrin IX monomethyl ester cyclase